MPANSWPENDSYSELEPIESLLDDDQMSDFFQGLEGRRRKAAVVIASIWSGTIALHLISWGSWLILGLSAVLWIQALRLLLARRRAVRRPSLEVTQDELPYVSLLVAAQNEEAVIGNLVRMLCNLDYPANRYDLWVIDDRSTDRTPLLLDDLQLEYKQLNVLHRAAGAGGGKSGALNQVLPLAKGEILAVFDADAQVSPDLLLRVVPCFQREKVGAVQVRKAIANAGVNFWTRGQMAEMALDSYFQQQRVAIGGIGELRGNGEFLCRAALERCGGWNEETITDDLDLTIRLHLDGWDIDFLEVPAVEEEGVTNAVALWHQRNRWAEGGFQRYLDYWRLIASNRMGTSKTLDLLSFMLIQYLLPAAAVPDCLMAIARHRLPLLSPLTALGFTLSFLAMFIGLHRIGKHNSSAPTSVGTFLVTVMQTIRGNFYMLHWLLVMASTTARMSVRPKRLKWVKTIHQGTGEVWVKNQG
jgi:1,2-diacylglycerol 3-beta-glucosyltransferase